ncbi:hypothetical protein Tco_0953285 [Tanacetum coccineum]|uniref:Uncharacterized protein n=1 Tax=Tanacetum coccineum TaxID=301880 RepID=A0ABQ5DZF9_9ASTR
MVTQKMELAEILEKITWLTFISEDAKIFDGQYKARYLGGNEESKKMRKDMIVCVLFSEGASQLNQMQARPDNEDCNMKFLRALPPSWSQTINKSSCCSYTTAFISAVTLIPSGQLLIQMSPSSEAIPLLSSSADAINAMFLKCSSLLCYARKFEKKAGKKVDSKTRYSQFKIKELDKSEEPKALVSVDSMLNWSDHESEDMEKGASEVYGMIAGYGDDAVIPAVDAADGVSTDARRWCSDGVSVTSMMLLMPETQYSTYGGNLLRSINLVAAVFVAVSILKVFKTEDLSRKLEVNYVKFQFRGGLYIVPAGYIVPTGRTN